jgi:hypothetical protein
VTKILRKVFANVTLDGIWIRGEDNTPDAEMDNVERRQCPVEKHLLAANGKRSWRVSSITTNTQINSHK